MNDDKRWRRQRAKWLLSVLLSAYLLILSGILFTPQLLHLSLISSQALTFGMLIGFGFIVFIIFITYIYAYPPGRQKD